MAFRICMGLVVWGKTFRHIIIIRCVYMLVGRFGCEYIAVYRWLSCVWVGEWAGRRERTQWTAWNRVASQMDSFDILVFVRRLFYYLSPLFLPLPLDVCELFGVYTFCSFTLIGYTDRTDWLRISLTKNRNTKQQQPKKKTHEKFFLPRLMS